MGNNLRLIQFVCFALNSLGDTNGHHDFEKIAYAFARHRLATNLLPPTGPVSAGGDQGRDGETFWSGLPGVSSTSVGRASVSPVPMVLACTTQTANVPTKIRQDLAKIAGSGSPVERVAYFTVTPIPLAKRHELIAEAATNFSLLLEIFDAQAIAENLADPDLFWVAEHFLHIPGDMRPEVVQESDLPNWYIRDRAMRQSPNWTPSLGVGEFVTLRDLARWALFEEDARTDLGDWLMQLAVLARASPNQDVRLRALYELTVLSLRSSGSFVTANQFAIQYFDELIEVDADPSMLDDAVTLLRYCYGSWFRRETTFSYFDLDKIYSRLDSAVSSRLDASPASNLRAYLLALRINLSFMAVYPEDAEITADDREFYERTRNTRISGVSPLPVALPVRNLDRAMHTIDVLLHHLPQSPLFPIAKVADVFQALTLTAVGHPDYRRISRALDSAVGRQAGAAAEAALANKRALLFLEAGQHLMALEEVHAAKLNWWHGDHLLESIEMMQLASRIYSRMNFHLAAKQYAVMAANVAAPSPELDLKPHISQGLFTAASADYEAGQWMTGNANMYVAALAHAAHSENPYDVGAHEELEAALQKEALKLVVARQSFPEYVTYLEGNLAKAGLLDVANSMADEVDFEEASATRVVDHFDAAGSSRPFADAGERREYRWWYQGQRWEFRCENSRTEVLAAERIIAAVQILQIELLREDCLWVPGDVQVFVTTDALVTAREVGFTFTQGAREWSLVVEPVSSLTEQEFFLNLAAVAASILSRFTLLTDSDFMSAFKNAWGSGAGHKISSGRPYDECADFIPNDSYALMAALEVTPFWQSFAARPVVVAPEMELLSGPHRLYNRGRALKLIRARYEGSIKICRFTLAGMLDDAYFKQQLRLQKQSGWLDWQIFVTVANAVGNHRVRLAGVDPADATQRNRLSELMRAHENSHEAVEPATLFADVGLIPMRDIAMASVLEGYSLRMPTGLVEMDGVYLILRRRFAFFIDDVPHELALEFATGEGGAAPDLMET